MPRFQLCLLSILILAANAASTASAESIRRGQKSWNYSTYQAKLAPLKKIYDPYPIGLNIRKEFWRLQLDRAKMTFRTWKKTVSAKPDLGGTVTFGTAVNLDGDADFEVMQCGFKFQVPSSGHFVTLDFKAKVLIGVQKFPIEGCSNIWPLKRRGSKVPLIVVMGFDEGKLPDDARAPLLIYDPKEKKLIDTGARIASHESVVVDLDEDGNEDILACNYRNDTGQVNDGSVLYLRNTGSGLEIRYLAPSAPCMALEVMDLKANGHKSVLLTDVAPAPATDPSLQIKPERNHVFNLDANLRLSFSAQLPLPIFERRTFDGIAFNPGWVGNIGRSHDVEIARGDIDNDGFEDAIVSSMLENVDRPMAAYQILRNKNGQLVDETDKRLFNELFAHSPSHNFSLRDINGDGFLDLVGQTPGFEFDEVPGVDTALTHGNEIYINDGTGHFVNVMRYQLGQPFVFAPWIFHLASGRPHWTRIRRVYGDSTKLEIDVAEYTEPLSTGPGLSNPAARGAPGFNEFYYLLNNADVADKVRTGKYGSGLDHYLETGRREGRRAFAPGAIVKGQKRYDGVASEDAR